MINSDTTMTLFNGQMPPELQEEFFSFIPKDLLMFAQINNESNQMVHDFLTRNVSELKRKNLQSWNFWYKNEKIESSDNKTLYGFNCLLKNCNYKSDWSPDDLNMPPLEHMSANCSLFSIFPEILDKIVSPLNKTDKAALAVTCQTNNKTIKDLFKRKMEMALRNHEYFARTTQERFIINFETMGLVINFEPADWERHFGVAAARNLH